MKFGKSLVKVSLVLALGLPLVGCGGAEPTEQLGTTTQNLEDGEVCWPNKHFWAFDGNCELYWVSDSPTFFSSDGECRYGTNKGWVIASGLTWAGDYQQVYYASCGGGSNDADNSVGYW